MAILEDMTAISEEEPLPIIRAYIDLNLLTLHQVPIPMASLRLQTCTVNLAKCCGSPSVHWARCLTGGRLCLCRSHTMTEHACRLD
jgi:hypothetical protein